MQDKRVALLADAPIKQAINKSAMPAIIGLMVLAIYNVVDTMFVAWLGTNATGATQVVLPIMMLMSAIGLSFGIGGGSYLSRLMGRKEMEKAEHVAATSFVTAIITGIIIILLSLIFIEPVLTFFGADASVMAQAKDYGMIILAGSIFQIANMVMNNLLRSEGSAKFSMLGLAIGAILNIILDPIFIFVFGWGIQGAAIATILAQSISTMVLLSNYMRHKTIVHLKLKYFQPKWETYKEILVVGLPTFMRQLLLSIAIALLNQAAIEQGGPDLLAAIGIVTRGTMIPLYVVFGIGQGFQPVAGFNFGAGDRDRVMEAFKYSTIISTVITAGSAVFFVVFSEMVMNVFRASEGVAAYGVRGLKFYAISLLLMGVTNTVTVFYQALGRGTESLLLSITRQGIFFIPIVLILPNVIGAEGVLMTQALADILTLILTLGLIIPFLKKDGITLELSRQMD